MGHYRILCTAGRSDNAPTGAWGRTSAILLLVVLDGAQVLSIAAAGNFLDRMVTSQEVRQRDITVTFTKKESNNRKSSERYVHTVDRVGKWYIGV